jgi:hypothetical protein
MLLNYSRLFWTQIWTRPGLKLSISVGSGFVWLCLLEFPMTFPNKFWQCVFPWTYGKNTVIYRTWTQFSVYIPYWCTVQSVYNLLNVDCTLVNRDLWTLILKLWLAAIFSPWRPVHILAQQEINLYFYPLYRPVQIVLHKGTVIRLWMSGR